MTSLYPGMLFYSSGLNKKSTPYGPEVTPSEIDQKLGRVPFNGRPWPKSSPVSTIYDVRNSSTRMIILNNKLSKRPKGSRLRGQTDFQGEIQHPEPFRHVTEESHTNWEHHKSCTTSVSEKFIPVFPRGVSPLPEWVNKTQRPPMKFDNGSGVNPNHHIQCQGHLDYDIVRWYNTHRRPRAQSRTSSVRDNRAMSPILNDPNLSRGEKRYLNHIAKIYSVDNMRAQKQHQYNKLMHQEISKGISKESDWQKYHRYLNTPRKTQFGPCDPKRSVSVAGNRSKKEADETVRPHTTQTVARPTKGSRGISTAGSSSRSQDDRSKPKGMNQRYGVRGKGSDKKNEDLTGKPARVESPLPLAPKRQDSVSSLSSLGSEDDKGDKQKKESKSEAEISPPQERGKRDGVDSEDKREVERKKDSEKVIKVEESSKKEEENKSSDDEKRKEDDDDERSKLSARDTGRSQDDQPGRGVEYVPLKGERQGEENDRSPKEKSGGQTDENKPEIFRPKSPEKEKKVQSEVKTEENPVVLLPPAKENVTSSSDTDKSQDDDSNGPKLIHHQHKEGGDRPLSRLGGRGQFTLVKKGNNDNSDDDYSDDDEKETQARSGQEVEDATDQPRGDNSNAKVTTQSSNGGDSQYKAIKQEEREGNDVLLPLYNEGDADDAQATTKDSPTGNSSQEKHSTITTVEY